METKEYDKELYFFKSLKISHPEVDSEFNQLSDEHIRYIEKTTAVAIVLKTTANYVLERDEKQINEEE